MAFNCCKDCGLPFTGDKCPRCRSKNFTVHQDEDKDENIQNNENNPDKYNLFQHPRLESEGHSGTPKDKVRSS